MNDNQQPIIFDNLSPEEVVRFLNGMENPDSMYGTGVYLGGPITEFEIKEDPYAVTWRQTFEEGLTQICPGKFNFYNPVQGTFDTSTNLIKKEPFNQWRFTDHYILDNCTEMMRKSSILLFNFLNSDYTSAGTFWEIGLGFGMPNKYIILIDEEDGRARNHAMIKHSCNFIVETLFDAQMVCKYISEKV